VESSIYTALLVPLARTIVIRQQDREAFINSSGRDANFRGDEALDVVEKPILGAKVLLQIRLQDFRIVASVTVPRPQQTPETTENACSIGGGRE